MPVPHTVAASANPASFAAKARTRRAAVPAQKGAGEVAGGGSGWGMT